MRWAQAGGLGVIHRNFEPKEQADQVRVVKKFESGMVVNPLTIGPDSALAEALEIMGTNRISGIPVVEKGGKLVGILTNRDVRFATDQQQPVRELMTHENLVTVQDGVDSEQAKRLLHQHRIEKLVVVDDNYRCVGLITVKDIEKAKLHPNASKDEQGRLRVAAATNVGDDGLARTEALIDAGCDIIVVDTAHGHSSRVLDTVSRIKKLSNYTQVVAGNIATKDGAKALVDAGADSVKVGIGPGSICTTRVVAGVGVPQLSAIAEAAEYCLVENVPMIADGGIRSSGDIAKAVAGGASCVMIGSLLAGTEEAPGEVFYTRAGPTKPIAAWDRWALWRAVQPIGISQQDIKDTLKLVPEGIEGQVPYKGPVGQILHQLDGGLRASMGYTGNATIAEMQRNCSFRRLTLAGVREGHVHDVMITRESPNYQSQA